MTSVLSLRAGWPAFATPVLPMPPAWLRASSPRCFGGVYGAIYVAIAAYAAPRIGLASLITIGIAGQIVMALWLDHIGALGLPREPVSLVRAGGALLVVAGVVLVRKG